VRPFIEQSSCVVLPSYREGMPRIILEALSMGKPVITTETAGCRETVVEGVNGFLVPVKDSNALVHAINKFLSYSPEKILEMGRAGREMAEKEFSDTIIADKIYDIISKV
jgi:glycosyltransferase involved in cell wall biosynthesis